MPLLQNVASCLRTSAGDLCLVAARNFDTNSAARVSKGASSHAVLGAILVSRWPASD